MIIVHDQIDNEVGSRRICLVFGAGLIGARVIASLQRYGMGGIQYHPFSWDQETCRVHQLEIVDEQVDTLLESMYQGMPESVRLTVLWSAGRGGFASSEGDLSMEVISFRQVLDFANRLFLKHRWIDPSFHMLSSAGGLFEGQTNVGLNNQPRPLRPYGWNKLEQEDLMDAWNTHAAKYCYRISSAYGLPLPNQRMGLIPTLLQNGIQRRVVNFSGGMDTVRDYVAVEDIGRFISARMLNKNLQGGTFTLASTQATTLYQLKVAAERCIQRKIYAHFELDPENSADNSFLASVLPSGWRPTPVATGLWDLYNGLLQGGMCNIRLNQV